MSILGLEKQRQENFWGIETVRFLWRLAIGGMRIKKYWINGYKNNQRKKGGIILFDMYVSKWYSVRDKMFYKDVYIMQRGVWYKLGKSLKGKELGAGLYQRKDGKYCGRFYDRFGIRRYVYGKTISETKEKLNTAMYEDK